MKITEKHTTHMKTHENQRIKPTPKTDESIQNGRTNTPMNQINKHWEKHFGKKTWHKTWKTKKTMAFWSRPKWNADERSGFCHGHLWTRSTEARTAQWLRERQTTKNHLFETSQPFLNHLVTFLGFFLFVFPTFAVQTSCFLFSILVVVYSFIVFS